MIWVVDSKEKLGLRGTLMRVFLFSTCIVLLGCSIYFFNYFEEYPAKESSSKSELTNVIEQVYNNNSPIVIRKKLDIEKNYKV